MVLSYVDDNFGAKEEGELEFYEPYGYYYLASQTRLLCLWDELGTPHKLKKQVYGPIILIIGFSLSRSFV
ncbi:hypothetical protein OBBRIDRAFT_833426 [Obba rivulosa]|uniref:Uncharacterized protein n=1 Tax=Obba rivulosa TaxID=1052685 RepID=A0A8E2B1S1_9APHY|nr:hypothetical protein OBBRIDRAFT_833426 [Obba rivulosa]